MSKELHNILDKIEENYCNCEYTYYYIQESCQLHALIQKARNLIWEI